jgi:hypothetical protein
MIELELTRVPEDRRRYRLAGIGSVRLEGWFTRGGSAEADGGASWRFSRRGLFGRVIEATDVTGATIGRFTPREIRRGGKLCWGTRELKLHPVGLRERYILSEADRDLAHLDAKGWGKRPVRISLAVDPNELDPGLLLYAAFIVHQLAGDAATAASTGTVAATGAYSG